MELRKMNERLSNDVLKERELHPTVQNCPDDESIYAEHTYIIK